MGLLGRLKAWRQRRKEQRQLKKAIARDIEQATRRFRRGSHEISCPLCGSTKVRRTYSNRFECSKCGKIFT